MSNEDNMSVFYCEETNYKFLDDNVDFLPYIEKYKGKKFIDMMIEIENVWNDKSFKIIPFLKVSYLIGFVKVT